MFSHKISIINRIFGSKWGNFGFKSVAILVPYFGFIELEKRAVQEHLSKLYNLVEDDYRKYKNTGDILQLNP